MTQDARPKFNRDRIRENAVSNYLDEKLYPIFFESSERCFEKKMQFSGVDVIAKHLEIDYKIMIDEKAATSWAHKFDIKTFAFELEWMMGEQIMEGWFLNKENKKLTTHWLLCWPRTSGEPLVDVENITKCEVMLLDVRKLKNWVRSKSSKATQYLEEVIQELRNGTKDEILWCGLRVIISRGLAEKPINLLIPRNELRNLSEDFNWFI